MFKKLATFLLGGFVFLICLEVGCRVAYKAYAYARDRENQKNLLNNPGEIRILAVGESTTGVAGDESGRLLLMRTSYPAQLQDLLNSEQNKIHFRVINAGIMAGNTSLIIDELDRNLKAYKPQIVIAMMGLKDRPRAKGDLGSSLKTVQLARWLFETISLKMKFCDGCMGVITVDRGRTWWMPRYIRETRITEANYEDDSPLPLLNQAFITWNLGHHQASTLLFKQITDRFQVGFYFWARMLASDGQFDQALQVVSRAQELDPNEGMYRIAEAELYGELGQFRKAQAVLDKVGKRLANFRKPQLIENFKLLADGEILRRQHDYKKALRSVKQVDEKFAMAELVSYFPPLDMLKEGALGEIYFDMGDWAAAKTHLSNVIAKYPMESAYHWQLAAVYRKMNDLEGEEKMRQEILKRRDYEFRLADYYEYYKLLKLMGKTEQIPALFKEVTDGLPSLSENFAKLYERTKRSGAKLILMQYPGFSTDIMEMYAPQAKDITVVDNEHLFDADPERYFFEPRYPYAYSHFTKDGAALVARQAKSAIESYLNGEGR